MKRKIVKYFWSIVSLLFLVSGGYSLSTFWAGEAAQNLMISEVMVANNEGLTDEDGDYSDWIELYNAGSRAINLSGWALTNNPEQPRKWMFPNVSIGSHEYLIVFASGKDRQVVSRDLPLHTNFKLSLEGDFIGLYNIFDDKFDDSLSTENVRLFADVAYGRSEAEPSYGYLTPATPGQANESTLVKAEMLAPSVAGTVSEAPAYPPPAGSAAGASSPEPLIAPANSLIQITELMYNPPGSDDYEFIELTNISDQPLDLSGASFEGIRFVFPFDSLPLAAGEELVLVRNQAAFAERYPEVVIAGDYDGQLSNDGEQIRLKDAFGHILVSLEYDDEYGWPLSADGQGDSLVLIKTEGNPNNPRHWRASRDVNGAPGSNLFKALGL